MSELGPGPEAPIGYVGIPLLDLRERIRLDHGLPALTRVGKTVEAESGQDEDYDADVNPQSWRDHPGIRMMALCVVVLALLILFMVKPAFLAGVIVLGLVLRVIGLLR